MIPGEIEWKHMSDASKRKEKHKWTVAKPTLDNARRLRGVYFIDPDDEEFKDIRFQTCSHYSSWTPQDEICLYC